MAMDVYRTQEFREPCTRCGALGTSRCPRCHVWVCGAHAGTELDCCGDCAAELVLALSQVGKGQRGLGAAVTFFSTGAIYILSAYHLINFALWAALLATGGIGVGLVGWSFLAGPVARKRLEKTFAQARALPPAPG